MLKLFVRDMCRVKDAYLVAAIWLGLMIGLFLLCAGLTAPVIDTRLGRASAGPIVLGMIFFLGLAVYAGLLSTGKQKHLSTQEIVVASYSEFFLLGALVFGEGWDWNLPDQFGHKGATMIIIAALIMAAILFLAVCHMASQQSVQQPAPA
jgi:hypothetical protein